MWKCSVCNYVHEGDHAPEKCPKCGAPAEKFNQFEEAQVELVHRSRYGNSLLVNLIAMTDELEGLAEEGIEDNLDPACSKLWEAVLSFAKFARQSAKAEVNNHIAKGKWN